MNFHEGEFDAILDKATLDAVLVFINSLIVRLKLNSQRQQTDIRSLPSSNKNRSVHLRIIRTARVPTELPVKARIRMDSKSATSGQTNHCLFGLNCFRRKGITKRALHLHLQKGRKGLIIQTVFICFCRMGKFKLKFFLVLVLKQRKLILSVMNLNY